MVDQAENEGMDAPSMFLRTPQDKNAANVGTILD